MDFETHHLWTPERPHILVVACSDGRLQQATDEFLQDGLHIDTYDRLYLPGGPGALATGGMEFTRVERARHELRFLVEAHQIERLIFVFHGPTLAGGPEDALCADYVRNQGHRRAASIRALQMRDAIEVLKEFATPKVATAAFYCEVASDYVTRFLPIVP